MAIGPREKNPEWNWKLPELRHRLTHPPELWHRNGYPVGPQGILVDWRNLQMHRPLVWHVRRWASWPLILRVNLWLFASFYILLFIKFQLCHISNIWKKNPENSINRAHSVVCGVVPVCKLLSVQKEASRECGSKSLGILRAIGQSCDVSIEYTVLSNCSRLEI